jgi:diguanylate cyclase (GGDEF)-like protein
MSTSTVPELIDALILVIDDDEENTRVIRESLTEFKNVKVFHDGESALAFCRIQSPDLVLLDVEIPPLDGWAMCKDIREMTLLSHCPIIFMADGQHTGNELKVWQNDDIDILRKPIIAAALNMRVMALLTTYWHIEIANRLYHTDILTGLNNRYFFDKHIKDQIAYAERYNSDLSLLIIDIDRLNSFNEKYGDAAGDKAIKQIASVLRHTVNRKPDSVCRYGGEEFAIILPGTNKLGAQKVAQRIQQQIQSLCLGQESEHTQQLTVSIGVSSLCMATQSEQSLFEIADASLQATKIGLHVQLA